MNAVRRSGRGLLLFGGACVLATLATLGGPARCALVAAAVLIAVQRLVRGRRNPGQPGFGGLVRVLSGVVGLLVVLNLTATNELSLTSRLLGNAIIALGLLPFLVWSHRRDFPIPLFPAITGIYVLYFGVPVFLASQFRALRRPVKLNWMVPAQWLALAGLVMLEAGYYWVAYRRRARKVTDNWVPVRNQEPEPVWIGLGILGVLLYVFGGTLRTAPALAQPVALLTSLATLVAVEFYMRWRGRHLSLPGVVFLFGLLIPIRVIFGFSTGANNEALSILIALGIGASAMRKRIPWIGVAVAVTVLVVLQPIKLAFRQTHVYGSSDSVIDRSLGYASTALGYARGEGQFIDARDAFVVRFGFLTTLAAVQHDTPGRVPYWDGTTYLPLAAKVIPRVLLPWKPQEVTGQTFGHRYQFLSTYDTRTSYNMPILVEFYANFGPLGVLVGMFGLGSFYAYAQSLVLRRIEPAYGSGCAVFVVAQLVFLESALSFVLASFLYAIVLIYLVGFGARVLRPEAHRQEANREIVPMRA